MFKIYNDTEFTTQFFRGLDWVEGATYTTDGKTATEYTARKCGKTFRKTVWSDNVIIYAV